MVLRRHTSTSAFTLLEVVIVISLIAILSILAFFIINPRKQLEKAWDSQRKSHLSHLSRVLEDYYNDKTTYPDGSLLCYDQVQESNGVCSCHVCGAAGNEGALASYISRLYCDPEFARKNYLYQYDCSTSQPRWYRMCTALSADATALASAPPQNYNFGVSSNNVAIDECTTLAYTTIIPTPTSASPTGAPSGSSITPSPTSGSSPSSTPAPPSGVPSPTSGGSGPSITPSPTPNYCPTDPQNKFCIKNSTCNNCGVFSSCANATSCDQPLQLYTDSGCSITCQ